MKKTIQIILALVFLIAVSCKYTDDAKTVIKDGYIKSSGEVELYYQLIGTGRDTLVVVHGGPGAGMNSIMNPVLPLADYFVLLFYDQRRGGRSSLSENIDLLHADYFIEDLESVRRTFQLESMNIIAHSFGSLITAEYVKRYPHRVNRMVFSGAVGPSREQAAMVYQVATPSPDTALSNRAEKLLSKLMQGSANDPIASCLEYEEITRKLSELKGETITWNGTLCDAPAEAIAYYFQFTAQHTPRTFGDWDYTTGMDHVDAPLLVIHGEQDTLSTASHYSWAAALPNGNLITIPNAGKAAITDQPEFVVSLIKGFFNEIAE